MATFTYGGYTCGSCGTWVPNGCTHTCPTAIRWVNERIAAALERIAAALEALNEPTLRVKQPDEPT